MDEEIYDDQWPERPGIEDAGSQAGSDAELAIAPEQWDVRDRPAGEPPGPDTMEQPPVEEPPVDVPAIEGPPIEQTPAEEPPVEQPPAEEPPVEHPPAEGSPIEQTPAEGPPAEKPLEPVGISEVLADYGWVEELPGGEVVPVGEDDLPARDEHDFVEAQASEPGLEAIAASLTDAATSPAEAVEASDSLKPKTSHVGEEVVILGQAGAAAADSAIVAPDGSVLAAAEPLPAPAVDMGPERRGNLWVWVGLLTGFVIMAAAIGFAWWFFYERPVEVPNVVGRLPAQAAQALNDSGLRLGKVTETPTDTAPAGTVIVQSPEYGAKLKPGEPVTLVLAGSPEMAKVPAVEGVAVSEASRVLANARLSTQVLESYSSTSPVGFVQSQSPSAGAEAEPGSVVALIVSKGAQPATFRVPKLLGLPEADAAALLGTLEVRADVYRSFDNSLPAGVVIDQYPMADTQVPYDGVVQYLVCKGAGINNVTVPDVVGTSSDRAIKRLKETDLKAKISFQASSDVAKGQVISQLPAARDKTSAGETVGLVVSSGAAASPSVPSVIGKTADEASKSLTALGYRAVSAEVRTTSQTAGRVFGQLPAAGLPWPSRYPVLLLLAAP